MKKLTRKQAENLRDIEIFAKTDPKYIDHWEVEEEVDDE